MASELTQATARAQVERADRSVVDLIRAQQKAIETQLAGAVDSGAFVRAAISEIKRSPELQNADAASVLGSIMLAAQLKLEIGPALGQFWLTPRKVDGQQTCLPIVGYQGFIELAYRTGRVEKVEAFLVRQGDEFRIAANSERGQFFDWVPVDLDEKREKVGVVAVVKIIGAGTVWRYLPKEKVLARRPRNWEKTPWRSDEDAMWLKTGIRALAPFMPKSTELGLAVQVSRRVEEEGAVVKSVDGIEGLVVSGEQGDETLGGAE